MVSFFGAPMSIFKLKQIKRFGLAVFLSFGFAAMVLAQGTTKPMLVPSVIASLGNRGGADQRQASSQVALDAASLFAMAPGEEVQFQATPEATFAIRLDRIEQPKNNAGRVWIGHLSQQGTAYRVYLSEKDGAVSGTLNTPAGVFSLSGEEKKATLLDHFAAGLKPVIPTTNDFLLPRTRPVPPQLNQESLSNSGNTTTRKAEMAPPTGQTTIDVLVLTTPEFDTAQGGAPLARVNQLIAMANQSFLDSDIAITLNLVHLQTLTGYSSGNSTTTALNDISLNLNGTSTATALQVDALRAQYAADLVVYVRKYAGGGTCGVGWLAGYRAYTSYAPVDISNERESGLTVVEDGSYGGGTCSALTLAHEVGHNLGSKHDHITVGTDPSAGAFNYSFGHKGIGTGGQGFTTIMGYESYTHPTRVPVYSNPLISAPCFSSPCGIASGVDAADNATGFNAVRQKVAAWGNMVKLSVIRSGGSNGGFVYGGTSIYCGDTYTACEEYFQPGATVTLTATNLNYAEFIGWSGPCSGQQNTCTVTMDAAKTVTANFALNTAYINVAKTGTGLGTVTSSGTFPGTGVVCGSTCGVSITGPITLVATPAEGSVFTGWSGNCSGTGTCVLTPTFPTDPTDLSPQYYVYANFLAVRYTLTISKGGTGSGSVTASGINCGSDCSELYDPGTVVPLTPTPSAGSYFSNWGGDCFSSLPCTLTMNASKSVTVNFNRPLIAVSKSGTGIGVVTGLGINCGTDCEELGNVGTAYTLSAVPAMGSSFTGWSGRCSGTGTCIVTPGSEGYIGVYATFAANNYTVTVSKSGIGSGTVTGTGVNCGADCSHTLAYGSSYTLTAVPSLGSIFSGWSGATCAGVGPCQFTVTGDTTVSATFAPAPTYSLSIVKAGVGAGTVVAPGINCGSDCQETVTSGMTVSLTATPFAKSRFAGWSGGGCSGNGSCDVTVAAATTVTASFEPAKARWDFNGDGKGDLLFRDKIAGLKVALLSGSSATWGDIPPVPFEYELLTMGDFDGDGMTDLLWRDMNTFDVRISYMNGASIRAWETLSKISTKATPQGVGDFNGDGKSDIVWRNTATGNTVISLMNGTQTTWITLGETDPTDVVLGVGDFTGDGVPEILWKTAANALKLEVVNGQNVSWLPVENLTALNFAGIGDFDGDGKKDLWFYTTAGGFSQIAFMNGSQYTLQGASWGDNTSLTRTLIDDFDGDGIDDILWTNPSGGMSVMLVTGTGLKWHHNIAPAMDPLYIPLYYLQNR